MEEKVIVLSYDEASCLHKLLLSSLKAMNKFNFHKTHNSAAAFVSGCYTRVVVKLEEVFHFE